MKRDEIIETYMFIGDSTENKAKRRVKGQPTLTYTQTEIINKLSSKRDLVCGGFKLITGKDDKRIGYSIYFGKDKSNPEQIIKIIIDKEMIEKGDINALAIDSLCQYAVRVNHKNNKKLLIAGVASALAAVGMAGAIVGGLVWADKQEQKVNDKKTNDYQKWLQEERIENGTYKSWLEEQGLLIEEPSEEDKIEEELKVQKEEEEKTRGIR